MKLSLRSHLPWIILGIPLLSYLVLKPTFNLSLFGDDWEQLYFMWLEFDVRHSYHWLDIKSYLGPYNFSYSYLGLLRHFFGYEPAPYFYVSLFFRILATISLYFMVNFISKERLAGFLASILFIFSTAGLETTNWVFNMNTYLGVFLFNLSVIFYLKIRSAAKFSLLNIFFFIFLFGASLIVVSTRMHGAVPFLLLIDLILLLLSEKRISKLKFFLRILIPIFILIAAINIGALGHVGSGGFTDRLKLGLETSSDLLSKGQFVFLFFLPGIIGHIALPDTVSSSIVAKFGLVASTLGYIALLSISVLLTIYILKTSSKIRNKSILTYFGLTSFWLIVVFIIRHLNPGITSDHFFSIFIGGETLFLISWLFLFLKNKFPAVSFTLMFSLLWLISFSLLYWLFSPVVFPETTSRYLTMGAMGFAIFLGSFLSFLIKNVKPRITGLPILFLAAWLIANFWAGQQYFKFLDVSRNSKLANSIWESLTSSIKDLDTENPTVFFFTTDNLNTLYWNVEFGFPMHMGLTYRINDLNNTPLSETNYTRLLEFVKDGSPLLKVHGRPIKQPVPIDHIYAYHLIGDKMINQTDLIRQKISEDLKNLK